MGLVGQHRQQTFTKLQKPRHTEASGFLRTLWSQTSRVNLILEGPKKSLQLVYKLILQSASHTKIKVLVDQPIKKREFPKWFMGLMRPSQSELLDILNWEWWDNINDRPWNNRNNVGIQKLHEFCNQLGTEPAGSYEL